MLSRISKLATSEWDPRLQAAIDPDSRSPLEQGLTRFFAHCPEQALGLMKFAGALKVGRALPERLVELVRLRIAFFNQCRSCMAIRYRDALDDGLDEALVCSLERPQEAENLSDAEKAAIRFGELMATDHLAIGDAHYAELRRHFSEAEIVELGMTCAFFVGFGRLAATWHMVEELPEAFQHAETIAPWGQASIEVRQMASKTDVAVNLFDPAVQQCPYAAYKTLRDEAPAYNIPGTEIWVVTRYDDVRRVLTDADASPSTSKNTAFRAGDGTLERAAKVASRFAEKGWVPAPTLNGRDDPNHKQMRAMFNEAFKPSRIKEIDSKVESLAYDLIDAFLPDGHCDWVSQFAVPLPLFIIGEQMGAPREDMWQIKRWTDAFFQRISFMLPEDQHLEMVDREIEAQHYFQPIFERLRKNPDESLISVLVNTVIPEWGRPLNDNELHAEMMADTFVGGSETTTNALAAGMKLLIENKDVWHQLKSDPERYMKTFVEEVVRLESPVQSLMRFCARDTELSGITIPDGAMVNVRFAAANRDERAFDNPDKIDLDRPKAGSHMGFGSGTHHCLGAPLARRELTWGFTAAVDRFEDMWFAEGKNDFAIRPHFLLRSLAELHIEFEPKKR